jgi:hypothetical protein
MLLRDGSALDNCCSTLLATASVMGAMMIGYGTTRTSAGEYLRWLAL